MAEGIIFALYYEVPDVRLNLGDPVIVDVIGAPLFSASPALLGCAPVVTPNS